MEVFRSLGENQKKMGFFRYLHTFHGLSNATKVVFSGQQLAVAPADQGWGGGATATLAVVGGAKGAEVLDSARSPTKEN